ncbi:disintegrin and metalloproteinase domain-containing protein 11-like isoform X2 [Sardina pilchardus]|uniref:disintegrin and metalloproteinase domain-containing protein 11-like isoform X2 n=1 Tax=Sardina pilchardus TaxID=27697 RepID=UPI002E14BA03
MLSSCCLLLAALSASVTCTDNVTWKDISDWGHLADQDVEITVPKRLLHQIDSDEELAHERLDTRVNERVAPQESLHLAQTSFSITAFSTTFILDLQLNHDLLSSDYVERVFDEEGRSVQTTGGEHCYYHGNLRGVPQSWAALSTCHGLQGMFSDGIASYGIEPVGNKDSNVHAVLRMPNLHLTPQCSECTDDFDSKTTENITVDTETPDLTEGLRRSKRQVKRGQRTVLTETKYIELLVVNDHDLFLQMRRSVFQTRNFAKAVVNMADAIYKDQLNTRIVLVAMETWTAHNLVAMGDDPLTILRDFMKYRKENIRENSDAAHLFSGRTFMSHRHGSAYVGGVCSAMRGGGVNEYGNVGPMAITLCQTLGQNIGMMWSRARASAGECRCPDPWLGCIMEDTGFYLPRKFSRCSIEEYQRFLQQGGGHCLFNTPTKLLDPPECGNGFVEMGEECDCGSALECSRVGGACCKKCTLTHDAMCSNGLCCQKCRYELRGVVCRDAVNECDISETCTGDSRQCPPNVHKLNGYMCDAGQGRCYGGRCKTRDSQCWRLWGHSSADRICYEKLNTEGSERGNCGKDSEQNWLPCNKQDVLCGFLLCSNVTQRPRIGDLQGEISSITLYHQNKYLDCLGGHAVLDDGVDAGYVEDGTPCAPGMMCLDRRCVPLATFNLSACPGSSPSRICSDHGTCSNEVRCICDLSYTGKDCSVFDPILDPPLADDLEQHKGPSGTNIIIGSIAGAILLGAIVLGGTGWGFKNIRRGRSSGV